MRWIESMAVLAATVASIAGASAQILVVRATGPSAPRFKPGTALPANGRVALKPGDLLVLLDEQSSWTLRGPGTMPVRARATPVAAPRLMSVNERRARIGAVRTPDAQSTTRPNLWMIDVAQPGPACIVDPAAPLLWRADDKDAGKTVVTGRDGLRAEVAWSVGQESHAWPATLPLTPGASYRMGATSVTIRPIAPPDSVADAGKALLANGCTAQLDLLVAQMAAQGRAEAGAGGGS